MVQEGRRLPGVLPYMTNWASKRRMACKMDQRSVYNTPTKKEAFTPHFEHKLLACLTLVRNERFRVVARMTGRYGLVLLVRGLIQARASGIVLNDWHLYVHEVTLVLEAVLRYHEQQQQAAASTVSE